MNGKLKSWLTAIVIVIVLMIPIVVNYIKSKNLEVITYDEFTTNMSTSSFSLTYVGDINSSDYEDIKNNLLELRNKYDTDITAIDKNKLLTSNWNSIQNINKDNIQNGAYVFVKDGEIVYAAEDLTTENIETLIDKYLNNVIPEDEIYYKTFKTYDEFMKIVKSKKVAMIVFGRDTCGWCNKFKPTYNDVANEYNLDIYYVDSGSFDSTEYSKIMKSDLKILAKCTDTGTETSLSSGFGTPLTLFTKSGKTIDCISGYTNRSGLLSHLKDVGMID